MFYMQLMLGFELGMVNNYLKRLVSMCSLNFNSFFVGYYNKVVKWYRMSNELYKLFLNRVIESIPENVAHKIISDKQGKVCSQDKSWSSSRIVAKLPQGRGRGHIFRKVDLIAARSN